VIEAPQLAQLCAKYAADKKATEIVILDLRGISTVTEFFVICSGGSAPQLKAIGDEIQDGLRREHGVKSANMDGFPLSQWVILDYAYVMVHVFAGDKRKFYDLERLWGDAPRQNYEVSEGA
jgi:ribosome-associated protein